MYGSGLNEYNLYAQCEEHKPGVWFDSKTGKMTYSLFPWQMFDKESKFSQKLEVVFHDHGLFFKTCVT